MQWNFTGKFGMTNENILELQSKNIFFYFPLFKLGI